MESLRQPKWTAYLKAALVVAFFSELYFTPIDSGFRFSASIIVLNAVLLLSREFNPMKFSLLTGGLVLIIRIAIQLLFSESPEVLAVLPSYLYYCVYGSLHYWYYKNKSSANPLWQDIFIFIAIDLAANTSEALLRGQWTHTFFTMIFLAAVIRGLAAILLYLVVKKRALYVLNEAHQSRYIYLNQLFSEIQSELVYLEKSSDAIEKIMSDSYQLYNALKEVPEVSDTALTLAREVHEVKKDYQRVMAGFNQLFENEHPSTSMTLGEANGLMVKTAKKVVREHQMEGRIHIETFLKGDAVLIEPYAYFSMVNNLIINAIENAVENRQNQTLIEFHVTVDSSFLDIVVKDDGMGIEEALYDCICLPGFTTKFGDGALKASSGMGLAHVKHMVEKYGGTLTIASIPIIETRFHIRIPQKGFYSGGD